MRKWIVLATIAGLCALGGVAYASIPDSNGTIHSCYNQHTGLLRVIDSASGGGASYQVVVTCPT